jgi:hypothetical protein
MFDNKKDCSEPALTWGQPPLALPNLLEHFPDLRKGLISAPVGWMTGFDCASFGLATRGAG